MTDNTEPTVTTWAEDIQDEVEALAERLGEIEVSAGVTIRSLSDEQVDLSERANDAAAMIGILLQAVGDLAAFVRAEEVDARLTDAVRKFLDEGGGLGLRLVE